MLSKVLKRNVQKPSSFRVQDRGWVGGLGFRVQGSVNQGLGFRALRA